MDGTGVKCKKRKSVKASRKSPSSVEKKKSNANFGYMLK